MVCVVFVFELLVFALAAVLDTVVDILEVVVLAEWKWLMRRAMKTSNVRKYYRCYVLDDGRVRERERCLGLI